MKNKMRQLGIAAILLLCAVFLLSNNNADKERYFLIGYAGTSETNQVWTGGYDTTMIKYPNLYEFIIFFEKRYKLTKCRILGITEFSAKDRLEFWRK